MLERQQLFQYDNNRLRWLRSRFGAVEKFKSAFSSSERDILPIVQRFKDRRSHKSSGYSISNVALVAR